MMSLDVTRSRLAGQLRAEDWEPWKSFIRDMFLVKRMEVNAIVAELHRQGFEITKPQLEYRLKLWGFYLKLKPEIWRTVKSYIVARAADRKQSVVILSGLRLPAEKVEYEMERNRLVTMRPAPNPKAIPGHIPLYICTPRSSSTDLTIRPDLPEDLPWLQFSRTHLPAVLGWMGFAVLSGQTITIPATGPVADFSLSQLARQGPIGLSKSAQSAFFPGALQQIVRRSLVNLIGSEEMTIQLLGKKSIDCLAACLDLALPETYRDENVYRVSVLVGGHFSEVQAEAFKIILYLISNRLIMDYSGYDCYLDDAQALISLCRLSGLAERLTIDNLVRLSRTSPTLTAVVDAIFEAAVNTEAVDFVEHLLDVDKRIHPDRNIGRVSYLYVDRRLRVDNYGSPLGLAVVRGSVDLVKVLLDQGADIHQTVTIQNLYRHSLSLTAAAALLPSRILSRKTVKLLVERGADINEDQTPPRSALPPLHAAILMGDTDLIKFLVAEGADVNHRHIPELYEPSLHDFLWHPFDGVVRNMHDVGYLGIATLFGCFIGHANPRFTDHQERQKKVLDLCQWIFENFPSWTDLSGYETKDAMILAAAQGYSDVVSFLYSQGAASLDAASCYFSPMIAAVTFGNTDTCRLLLALGALSSQHEIDREFLGAEPYLRLFQDPDSNPEVATAPLPHLLHMAVASNCGNIVKLLIKHGADVDEVSRVVIDHEQRLSWPPSWDRGVPLQGRLLSPLQLAISSEYWDLAVILLTLGATPMASDLVSAAEGGNLELVSQLVSQLVRMGIDPNGAAVDGISALQTALVHGHGEIAEILFESAYGALDLGGVRWLRQQRWPEAQADDGDRSSLLECAILSGWSKAIKKAFSLDTTAYDSGALCAAVYMAVIQRRLPDEDYVLGELLHRRDQDMGRSHQDPILENTALSLAAWDQRLDIVTRLLARQRLPLASHFAIQPFSDGNWKGLVGPQQGCRPENYHMGEVFSGAQKWHRLPTDYVSALLFAVQGQNEEIIIALLDAGYEADGFTLRMAVSKQLPLGLIQRLTGHCTDVDAYCAIDHDSEWFDKITPLQIAASQGQTDIVRVLLSHGAKINEIRPRNYGHGTRSALTEAIQYKQWPTVSFLLDRGSNVNGPVWTPRQPFVTSPLQLAAEAGYIGIVRRLLADGADGNAQRSVDQGYTVLEGAAMAGRIDTVSLLLASNVRTEGYGRVQFVNAILEASKREHGATVAILRSHRPWTTEDQSIWEELEQAWSSWSSSLGNLWFLHPAEHSPGELVNIIATVQDDKYQVFGEMPRWAKPFCPQDWSKSAATEVLKYANIVIAKHPEITTSDAEDDAARVAETAFLHCIGKELKPGFWLGYDWGDLENPEAALSRALKHLEEWASSTCIRSADVPDHSDTLRDGKSASLELAFLDISQVLQEWASSMRSVDVPDESDTLGGSKSENPEQVLNTVSRALQEWASSVRSADVPDESDTLGVSKLENREQVLNAVSQALQERASSIYSADVPDESDTLRAKLEQALDARCRELQELEQALNAVSRALQEWASSMRSADIADGSDTLGDGAQLSWSDFEDFSGDTMSGVEDFAMGGCDEINTYEDMEGTFEPLNDTPIPGRNDQTNGSDVVEHGENQGETRGSFEDEDSWEARRRAVFRDMMGEEEAPFMAVDFQI